jgi:hypothetical protein
MRKRRAGQGPARAVEFDVPTLAIRSRDMVGGDFVTQSGAREGNQSECPIPPFSQRNNDGRGLSSAAGWPCLSGRDQPSILSPGCSLHHLSPSIVIQTTSRDRPSPFCPSCSTSPIRNANGTDSHTTLHDCPLTSDAAVTRSGRSGATRRSSPSCHSPCRERNP